MLIRSRTPGSSVDRACASDRLTRPLDLAVRQAMPHPHLKRAALLAIVGALAGPAPSRAAADPKPTVVVSPADPASVQRAIDEAIRLKLPKLTIPPGTYEVPPGGPPEKAYNFHLRVTGGKDLEIDATGVTFVFPKRAQNSMAFIDCENVTFRGATLKRKTSPVSQGVIEAIRDSGKSIDVKVDDGYPDDFENKTLWPTFWTCVYSMDRSRWLAHYRASTPKLTRLGPGRFRAEMTDDESTLGFKLQVGQPIAWRGEVYDDVHVRNCKATRFVGITVAGGSGMCFHEFGGDGGNVYRDCRTTYGDVPAGGTQRPLFSSSADSFHSGGARRGPVIENCLFEGADDDGIAIHGFYVCVVEATPDRLVVWRVGDETAKGFGRPGDALHFYDTKGAPAGTGKIASTRELPDYRPPAGYVPMPLYRLFSDVKDAKFVEVKLDGSARAEANWLVSNADALGSGYVIRNTTVRDNTARGLMVKAARGLIEGCTLERNARAAIELMPEHLLWPESDYSRDVTIRNNTIRGTSLNRQEGLLRHAGAIAIYAYRPDGGYVAGGGHRNIVIEGNTFDHNDGRNLLIASADGVTVRNNTFVSPMRVPSTFGAAKGVDPTALIALTQCANVRLDGNVVTGAGSGLKSLVGASPTASGTGFDTGVVRK